jgi:hypothetical protein
MDSFLKLSKLLLCPSYPLFQVQVFRNQAVQHDLQLSVLLLNLSLEFLFQLFKVLFWRDRQENSISPEKELAKAEIVSPFFSWVEIAKYWSKQVDTNNIQNSNQT